jgi:RES domain-containing protein
MNVCVDCINENYYKEYVKNNGTEGKCNYCKNKEIKICISIDSLANEVDDIYRADYEPSENSGDTPSYIISEMLCLDNEKIANDLVYILSERETRDVHQGADALYDSDGLYITQPTFGNVDKHMETWEMFCYTIKHDTRFFNKESLDLLDSLFSELDKFKVDNTISPVRKINPDDSDTIFYRARKANSSDEISQFSKNPIKELNAPPPHKTSSGRMNPIGVSVFYGAFELKTCIAEIRLAVGELAVSGQFKLEKSITVLDLTVLDQIDEPQCYSGDDSDNLYGLFHFLRRFSQEISKPILPNNSELEYLATQAFSEYLCNHYKEKIDAIIYPSSQIKEGKNIVIFNHIVNSGSYLSLLDGMLDEHEVLAIDYNIKSLFGW